LSEKSIELLTVVLEERLKHTNTIANL
jgi:hypothetical protein